MRNWEKAQHRCVLFSIVCVHAEIAERERARVIMEKLSGVCASAVTSFSYVSCFITRLGLHNVLSFAWPRKLLLNVLVKRTIFKKRLTQCWVPSVLVNAVFYFSWHWACGEVCIWISRWLPDYFQPLHELSVFQAPLVLWAWSTCPGRCWPLNWVNTWCVGTPTDCSSGSASPLAGALLIPESKDNAFVLPAPCVAPSICRIPEHQSGFWPSCSPSFLTSKVFGSCFSSLFASISLSVSLPLPCCLQAYI